MRVNAERLYPDPTSRRRAVAGWCLFDFANSSYTTLIVTVVFAATYATVTFEFGSRELFLLFVVMRTSSPLPRPCSRATSPMPWAPSAPSC